MGSYKRWIVCCVLVLCAGFCNTSAVAVANSEAVYVPPSLQPWVPWVLANERELNCPVDYFNGGVRRCSWPSALTLNVKNNEVSFKADWTVFAPSFVPLPGGGKNWPLDVKVDGRVVNVLAGHDQLDETHKKPSAPQTFQKQSGALNSHVAWVELQPGSRVVTGTIWLFPGDDVLAIPERTAFVQLLRDAMSVKPFIDQKGVWLRKEQETSEVSQPDQLDVKVFRLLTDDQMASLSTVIRLRVSGARREVAMGPSMIPDGFQVTHVDSPLPARIEKNGLLRIQVKPGDWQIQVDMRTTRKIERISAPALDEPWPASELWSVRSKPERRTIRVDGDGVPVDPSQTQIPAEWHSDSAYRLEKGQSLVLVELQRGHANPNPNQFSISRSMWMDFDGAGLTLKDDITGSMNQGWKLTLGSPFQLSRMSLQGEPAVVRQYGDHRAGVEIRDHGVHAEAVLRLALSSPVFSILQLPANGWSEEFATTTLALHLPPGWRLLGMQGADYVTNSWLHEWDLWDVFLLMIMVALLHSAFGKRVALLGGGMMVLLFHEVGVSEKLWVTTTFLVWCLVKINHRRATKVVGFLFVCTVVPLLMETLPFVVNQARIALHPQLDGGRHQIVRSSSEYASAPAAMMDSMATQEMEFAAREESSMPRAYRGKLLEVDQQSERFRDDQFKEQDAYTQTGASLPAWRWRSSQLSWTGPVAADQQLKLFMLNPTMTVWLALARVLLIVSFVVVIAQHWRRRMMALSQHVGGVKVAAIIPVMLMAAGFNPPEASAATASDMPSAEMLRELRERLIKPPVCAPYCSSVGRARLAVVEGRLKLDLHVMLEAAMPISLPRLSNRDRHVLVLVNGKPAPTAYDNGGFEVVVPAGHHTISMLVDAGEQRLKLTFPHVPAELDVKAEGWIVEGLLDNRLVNDSVELVPPIKQAADADSKGSLAPTEIKPLVSVIRRLSFGQDWYVTTEIHRVAPSEGVINVGIPLLAEERLMTEGLQLDGATVNVSLARQQQSISWLSRMQPLDTLVLKAPETGNGMETWILSADERWAIASNGLTEDKPNAQGRWQPMWTPWPGELLTLQVTALPLSPGVTATIDAAQFQYVPGERVAETKAKVALRNSIGHELSVKLPEEAEIQTLIVDGQERPVRFEKGLMRVLLAPGTHSLEWTWREDIERSFSLKTPSIAFDQPVSNISLSIDVPKDQWLLWVRGPDLGPAILYWGELVAVLLFAVLLGRLPQSPLKTAEWVLLGLGLSAQNLWAAAAVALALFSLALRPQWKNQLAPIWHNMMQVFLAFFWVISVGAVMLAVPAGLGLFGRIDMGVTGNGSYANWLNWYQDLSSGVMPQGEAIVVPLWVYRVLMLLWSFWLARALVRWALWSWSAWSAGGIMQPIGLWWRTKSSSHPAEREKNRDAAAQASSSPSTHRRRTLMAHPPSPSVDSDWVLLMTQGCHLCDEAVAWLSAAGIEHTDYNRRDVAEKSEWVEQWGTLIPVFLNENTGQQFAWPFAKNELLDAFHQAKRTSDKGDE